MYYFPVKNAEETACQQLLLHLQVLVFYSSPTRCIWWEKNRIQEPVNAGEAADKQFLLHFLQENST